MKEKPILFSAPMVRAILDCSKTMTRRLMNPQPSEGWLPYSLGEVHKMKDGQFVMKRNAPVIIGWGPSDSTGEEAHACPHPPGSAIWCKETFSPWADDFTKRACCSIDGAVYRADFRDGATSLETGGCEHWKPSIFMPRALSRITLEVTKVRVERLQDISAKDIIAEGAVNRTHEDPHLGKMPVSQFDGKAYADLRSLWAAGWESIHGRGSLQRDKGKWVWVYSFKKL
jgi:hypothetical protein